MSLPRSRIYLLPFALLLACTSTGEVGVSRPLSPDAGDTPEARDADVAEDDSATELDASEADASEADASEADASEADAGEADASEAHSRSDGGAEAGSPAEQRERVWTPLSVMQVVNPLDHGARGDGTNDDLPALRATVDALPAEGGVVFFPPGKTFKKNDLWIVTKNHVKLWALNRSSELFQAVNGVRRKQSLLCRNAGCGVFGLKLRSDASTRYDALEDHQISADHASLVEVVGCELQGSAAAGIFLVGSSEHYIEGNYVHHTWADHIQHSDGATTSWVWRNFIFNEAPSNGDNGIACVTYGVNRPRCTVMEWWRNTILHTGSGRGYVVLGGDDILIHDNWAIGVAGAGISVASEPPVTSFDSSSSQRISISGNYVSNCGHAGSHPNILISGNNPGAGPLRDIALRGNVSVGSPNGPYRAEGSFVNVSNEDLKTDMSALPAPVPTLASVVMADTNILRTRDVSHVAAAARAGLYRIHVRPVPTGVGFQQRFEYLVQGAAGGLADFIAQRTAAGDYLSEQRTVNARDYALLLCKSPIALPAGVSALSFAELREKDRDGSLRWLWRRVDDGDY